MLKKYLTDLSVKVNIEEELKEEMFIRVNTQKTLKLGDELPDLTEEQIDLVLSEYLKLKLELLMEGREVEESSIGSTRLQYRKSTTFNPGTPSVPTVVLKGSLDKDARKEALKKIIRNDDTNFNKKVKAYDSKGDLKLDEGMVTYIEEL